MPLPYMVGHHLEVVDPDWPDPLHDLDDGGRAVPEAVEGVPHRHHHVVGPFGHVRAVVNDPVVSVQGILRFEQRYRPQDYEPSYLSLYALSGQSTAQGGGL